MANTFVLILAAVTFVSGIFWLFKKFKKLAFIFHLRNQSTCRQSYISNIIIKTTINQLKKLAEFSASIFPVLLLVFIIRSFIFEPFQIPSGSMMPTLLSGDFILVEKFAYGIKNPITQTTLIKTGRPKRGDIVVFKYPFNSKLDYIKRVIGLPGDRVNYDPINKRLTVHFSQTNEQQIFSSIFPITYRDFVPSEFSQLFNYTKSGETKSIFLKRSNNQKINGELRLMQCEELFNNVGHNILIIPEQKDPTEIYYQQQGNCDVLAEWTVPQGKYFMMGDNRDNSADSRYWGFVPERNLVGKAIIIWLSVDKQEGQWPKGIRFSRIGSIY
ncbi:signal peptidase I [Sodalis sp. CWE]|uniref:signal peptidase I n=1 Tax=Sodalis sp. CWE TaxID=2803816 RepID=UPI001C7DDF72|nr:signal peptidase I [Sodalis sp. CWE]MBX4181021.1 signal peptidase I [Sodalis sp. CWE]